MPMKAGLTFNPYQLPDPQQSAPTLIGAPPMPEIPATASQQMAAQRQNQPRLLYSPTMRQYLINNVLVDDDDIEYLQRAPEFLSEPVSTDTPEGDWVNISQDQIQQRIQSLGRVSVGELVGSGTRAVAAGLLRGTGLLGESIGAPSGVTDLLQRAGDAADIPESMQGRLGYASEQRNLMGNMLAAVPQGGPSFAASIGGAAAGGLVGGPVGFAVGGFMTILPMMVDSAYQSAVQHQGQDFADSPEGRAEVISTAVVTSIVQAPVPSYVASRGLAMLSRKATDETLRRRGPGRLATAGVVGLTEAAAEASALAIEMAVFDPEARSMLDQGDIQTLMPYIVQTYGEELAISAFAGGVLGGTAGLVVGGRRTTDRSEPAPPAGGETGPQQSNSPDGNLNGSEPVDLLGVTVGEPSRPLFGNQIRQGVLPFSEFSEQDVSELSRRSGGRGETLSASVAPPEVQARIDATDSTGQGTLPFAIPESNRLAGPPDDSGPAAPGGMPPVPPNTAQQNLFDFGTPIPPGAVDQTQQAEPVVESGPEQPPPMAPNQRGTTLGAPFTSAKRAEMSFERIAKDLDVKKSDLEVVPVEGGFAVQVKAGAVKTPVEEGKRRPPRLYHAFGLRKLQRREAGIPPTRVGIFLSELRDYVEKHYMGPPDARGAVLSTDKVPTEYLDIDKLSAKTKAGEAAREKMRNQLNAFVDRTDGITRADIEDNFYLHDVLYRGQNDFTQPTQLDIDFLRSLGREAVYFSVEGPIGSGIETQVDTWFLFDNPFNDFVGEMRAAMGLRPDERTVAETREVTGYEQPPQQAQEETSQEVRTQEEVAETTAGQLVAPADAWGDVNLPIAWDDLSSGQKYKWEQLVATRPEETIESPSTELVVAEVLDDTSSAIQDILDSVDGVRDPANVEFILSVAFDSQYNPKGASKSRAARAWARSIVEEMSIDSNSLHLGFARYIDEFSTTHVTKLNGLNKKDGGDPLFRKLTKVGSMRQAITDHYGRDFKEDGTLYSKKELDDMAKAERAAEKAQAEEQQRIANEQRAHNEKTNPASVLAKRISDYREEKSLTGINNKTLKDRKKELENLWAAAQRMGQSDAIYQEGIPLASFFSGNEANFDAGSKKPTSVLLEQAESYAAADAAKAAQEAERKKAAEQNKRDNLTRQLERGEGRVDDSVSTSTLGDIGADFGLSDSIGAVDEALGGSTPRGRFLRADGKPITKPLEIGRAKMMVKAFVSKLQTKVNVGVYRNVADFKAKNPEAYEAALASRPDLGSVPASALYYGDGNIAVFTDSILTAQQLQVVLAHEALGHHGFRSLMPRKNLEVLMDSMYNRYDQIKAYVNEAIVAETGKPMDQLSKPEADRLRREFTEEYLADMAAVIDTNVLARIWSAVKTALERLTGVQFDDHMARYFVGQARRYVRNGKVDAAMLNWQQLGSAIIKAEMGDDTHNLGRYSRAIQDVNAVGIAAGTMTRDLVGIPVSIENLGEYFRRFAINGKGTFEASVEQLFSLRTFRFRENRGAELVFDAVTQGKNTAMRIINEVNEIMRDALDLKAFDRFAGVISKSEYDAANEMLYDSMFYSIHKFRASALGKTPLVSVNEATGEIEVNQTEVNRLRSLGELTIDQFKKGIKYRKEAMGSADGETVMLDAEVKARPKLTESSAEWKAYKAARAGVAHIWTQKLVADHAGFLKERDLNFRRIAERMDDDTLTPKDRALLDKLTAVVYELQINNMEVDDLTGAVQYNAKDTEAMHEFIENVNRAILGVESKKASAKRRKTKELSEEDQESAYDALARVLGEDSGPLLGNLRDFSRRLRLNKNPASGQNSEMFVVQNAMKDIIMHELRKSDSERLAKQSIAQGYTPLKRRGRFQMRIIARNERGEIVRLDDGHKNLLAFRMFETEAEALEIMEKVNRTQFTNDDGSVRKFEGIRAYDSSKGAEGYRPQTITLEAIAEQAPTEQAAPPQLNINEFMMGLSRFNIVLQPGKMQEVIVAMTKQNNAARKRLQRGGVKGYDPDGIRVITEFAESMGSNIAKSLMRPQISEYMDLSMRSSQKLWNGDKGYLQELKQRWEKLRDDPNASQDAVTVAKREYRKYAFQYNNTNPVGRAQRGNLYRNEAANLLAFLDGNANFQESTFESGPVVSRLRAYTSMFQLGGSLATGALNYIGMWMNGIPTLAGYNENRAFGGGFGLVNSIKEVANAMHSIGMGPALLNRRLNDADFYGEMIDIDSSLPNAAAHNKRAKELRNKYGLTEDEAEFIRKEISEGVMIPAQSNALLGTARGRTKRAAVRKAIDGWMWTFNQTEQGSRRSLGLAAYRLELKRQMAARSDPSSVAETAQARERARRFAVETLDQTVGRYDVSNRPPVWRGGLPAMMYMYKVFPTTSIQMLRNLPRNYQMGFLLGMWFLSGIRGFPFAEDIEDMIDTIAQGLGLKWRGTRIEMAEQVDKIFPGFSPRFVRGVLNSMSAGDIGIRTQLGDFIPGTGMFLAGANTAQEAGQIAGPMFGMITALGQTIPNIFRATTGMITGDQRVRWNDVARASPVTMARAWGDAVAYYRSGAVVDRRGYVVSPDVTAMQMLFRLGGWYPAAAANQYDIIRSTQRMTNYQRDITASYRIAWVRAMIEGDTARARQIERDVDRWNQATRGTALEIRGFRRNSVIALREAERSAVDRARRTSPISARDDFDRAMKLLGY